MSHFGILSFPATGHLHPLTALGRELVRRGHQVTVFQVADVEPLIRAAGLGFRQIGNREFPLGSLRPLDKTLGRLQGMKALDFIFQRFCQNSAMVLRDAPHALGAERIDALIVDQAEFAGGSVAERIGLPFVTAILTLPLNLDPCVPFCAFHSQPETVRGVPTRNLIRNTRIHFMASELCTVVNRQRKTWGLLPKAGLDAFYSELAQIAQVPSGFDFPGRKLSAAFHYTGPFVDRTARKEASFPWSKLDPSRPMISVSMGTLQNGIKEICYDVFILNCSIVARPIDVLPSSWNLPASKSKCSFHVSWRGLNSTASSRLSGSARLHGRPHVAPRSARQSFSHNRQDRTSTIAASAVRRAIASLVPRILQRCGKSYVNTACGTAGWHI
jgi:zeaxanthin glucosyltransferase